jgi:hypothetical protein
MLVEKRALSPEVLEAQTALELPDREMMQLITVNIGDVTIELERVNLGVCANITVIGQDTRQACELIQRQ